MVPFNGKKETYQFLRNVPFCIKNVSTCDKTYQLVAKSVQYARQLIKPRRILEYGHMSREHVTEIYYVNPK